jgi:hypothetical protein
MRQEAIPWAYRVFFRQVGIDPDDRRTPPEQLVLDRLQHGGFRSRSLLDDAMTIAIFETGVALLAFDGDRIELPLELRLARPGEVMGAAERTAVERSDRHRRPRARRGGAFRRSRPGPWRHHADAADRDGRHSGRRRARHRDRRVPLDG